MFQSVSGHSSEQSIANSQLTTDRIAAKMCLRHYIKLTRESPTTDERTQIFPPSPTVLSFETQIESNGLQSVDRNHNVSRRNFSTRAICKATSTLFVHKAAIMAKTDLTFLAFSLRFVLRFRSSILLSP